MSQHRILFFLLFPLLLAIASFNLLAKGIDVQAKTITISLMVEPPSLDSSRSEDTTSSSILRLINEGLVRIDSRGEIEPAVAESWVLGEREATFTLRSNASWQDGKPVTAQDFVYAWRRLVDPATAATGSAFFAYVLENATDIIGGKMPADSLGVKAVDERTLHVSLSRPVPYLLNVLAATGYLPLREDFVEAQKGRFAADADHLLSNGPFVLESWVHNSTMRLRRNPHYWNAQAIALNGIDVGYITSDVRSLLNLYKSHELSLLTLNEEILADAMDAGHTVRRAPTSCLAWVFLNMEEGRVTSNRKVREAIRLAFDRDRYVNNVVGLPGTRKIDSIFTRRINGVKRSFQQEYPAPEIDFDIARARVLIEQAKKEMGVKKIPPIVLLANETRQIEAEFIQAQLGSALGLEVKVDKQTFKQALAKMYKRDFDMARAGFCGGALRDPVFFAGVFESGSSFNDVGYNNPRYDQLMSITHSTADQQIRMDAFGEMQQLLYDDIPIIPTHESSEVFLQDNRLRGVMRYPLVDYSRGYLQ